MNEAPKPFATREEWLAARRNGLGGSDAAPAVGLSKWTTPLQLYLEKRGEVEPEPPSIRMMAGNALEPLILQLFADRTGLTLGLEQEHVQDPEHDWRFATVDAVSRDSAGSEALVEAKSTRVLDGWGDEYTDEVPLAYALQAQHNMAVTGLAVCWMPVLFDLDRLCVYRIERDGELIETLTARELNFWRRVERGEQPEPTSRADAKILWPADDESAAYASDDLAEKFAELRRLQAEVKERETALEAIKEEALLAMGPASLLLGPDGSELATYKANRKGSRVFRVKQAG